MIVNEEAGLKDFHFLLIKGLFPKKKLDPAGHVVSQGHTYDFYLLIACLHGDPKCSVLNNKGDTKE